MVGTSRDRIGFIHCLPVSASETETAITPPVFRSENHGSPAPDPAPCSGSGLRLPLRHSPPAPVSPTKQEKKAGLEGPASNFI